MLDSTRNLKTSRIELDERLPAIERAWLVAELRDKRGVVAAECSARALVVDYDADVWGSADLLDFLAECRVAVAGIRSGAGAPGA